jgi:hypothetical protein
MRRGLVEFLSTSLCRLICPKRQDGPAQHLHLPLARQGFSYYVLARAAFRMQRVPETGNLYHHALEYLMKAQLAKRCTEAELRNFRHRLKRIWKAFKKDFPNRRLELAAFDQVVSDVDAFERLRYPGLGMLIVAGWQRPSRQVRTANDPREYLLGIQDVDRLVAKLFEVMQLSPKAVGGPLHPDAQKALEENNPVASALRT